MVRKVSDQGCVAAFIISIKWQYKFTALCTSGNSREGGNCQEEKTLKEEMKKPRCYRTPRNFKWPWSLTVFPDFSCFHGVIHSTKFIDQCDKPIHLSFVFEINSGINNGLANSEA